MKRTALPPPALEDSGPERVMTNETVSNPLSQEAGKS